MSDRVAGRSVCQFLRKPQTPQLSGEESRRLLFFFSRFRDWSNFAAVSHGKLTLPDLRRVEISRCRIAVADRAGALINSLLQL